MDVVVIGCLVGISAIVFALGFILGSRRGGPADIEQASPPRRSDALASPISAPERDVDTSLSDPRNEPEPSARPQRSAIDAKATDSIDYSRSAYPVLVDQALMQKVKETPAAAATMVTSYDTEIDQPDVPQELTYQCDESDLSFRDDVVGSSLDGIVDIGVAGKVSVTGADSCLPRPEAPSVSIATPRPPDSPGGTRALIPVPVTNEDVPGLREVRPVGDLGTPAWADESENVEVYDTPSNLAADSRLPSFEIALDVPEGDSCPSDVRNADDVLVEGGDVAKLDIDNYETEEDTPTDPAETPTDRIPVGRIIPPWPEGLDADTILMAQIGPGRQELPAWLVANPPHGVFIGPLSSTPRETTVTWERTDRGQRVILRHAVQNGDGGRSPYDLSSSVRAPSRWFSNEDVWRERHGMAGDDFVLWDQDASAIDVEALLRSDWNPIFIDAPDPYREGVWFQDADLMEEFDDSH